LNIVLNIFICLNMFLVLAHFQLCISSRPLITSVQSVVSMFTRNVMMPSFRLICLCPANVALLTFIISSYGKVVFLFYVSFVLMFILSCWFFLILHLEQPDSLNTLLNTVMRFEVVARLSRLRTRCAPRHPLSARLGRFFEV
jgi:hypothetical protein